MALANTLSYVFGAAEIFLYAGCVFGWSFIEYILKQEGIFFESICGGGDDPETLGAGAYAQWRREVFDTHEHKFMESRLEPGSFYAIPIAGYNDTEPMGAPLYCPDGQKKFQSIYTWMLISQILGPLIFGVIVSWAGTFVSRFIASIMFTTGTILLIFYKEEDPIFWSLQLMGIPSIMFINFNISVLVPIFPSKGSLTIPFLHGLFSASGGMLLIMKLIYVAGCSSTEGCEDDISITPTFGLADMATVYACGTVIMHIQTFFFTPFKSVPMGVNLRDYNVYHDSIIGRFLSCGRSSAEEVVEVAEVTTVETKEDTGPSIKDSLLSLKYLSICVYCVILQTRMNSIPGWTFTWLQWAFGDPNCDPNDETLEPTCNPDATDNVDLCMDIFGFMFFASVLISPIPSMVIKTRTSQTGSIYKGKIDGLTFLFVCTTALGLINSIQMCFQGSLANSIMFVILYQFMRNFFFVSRSVFLYSYFPVEHFSILLGVSLLPIIISTFLIQVFFGMIMGEPICDEFGDGCEDPTVYQYDFKPVNIGFAIACGVAFYQLFYNIYLGKQLLRQAAAAAAGGVSKENEKTSDAQMKGVEGVTTEDERKVVDEEGFENTAYENANTDL